VAELRARFPGHAVLLCNVLGELDERHPEARDGGLDPLLRGIPDVLAGASWASYHDRISGPWPPVVSNLELPGAVSTEALLLRLYGEQVERGALEYRDHGTGELAPKSARRLWLWRRTATDFRVVEGVCG